MEFDKFLELLEQRADQKVKTLNEEMISGENVPESIKKKYGFKWAYIPEKYNIMIGLVKDSDDITSDQWKIVTLEPKSEAAERARKGMAAEFGESISESVDFDTYEEVSQSKPMNYETLLKNIQQLLENKTISGLHTTAAKLMTKKK